MVVDLKKCLGCQTCTLACKVANGLLPGVQRCRVVEEETGTFPDVSRIFISLRCMHCENPECMKACPTGATGKRADGIVTVDADKCMGCRYCALVCPYQARTFLGMKKTFFPEGQDPWEAKRYREHQVGTVEKCDFCYTRIDAGRKRGLKPGEDSEATPVCVISCIGKALYFGDLNDPDSGVSRLIRDRNGFVLRGELGTDPSAWYLPRKR